MSLAIFEVAFVIVSFAIELFALAMRNTVLPETVIDSTIRANQLAFAVTDSFNVVSLVGAAVSVFAVACTVILSILDRAFVLFTTGLSEVFPFY